MSKFKIQRRPETIKEFVNDMVYFQNYPSYNVHNYYLENGGKIKDHYLYHNILKLINIFIIDHVMTRGVKIEFPFFGELYVEEVKVDKPKKRTVRRNNFFHPQVVFKSFQQRNLNMRLYTDLVFDQVETVTYDFNKKVFKRKRIHTEHSLFLNLFRAKRKDRHILFYRKYKKVKNK